MYSGNHSDTSGNGFLNNSKYKSAIMSFEAVNERSVIILK